MERRAWLPALLLAPLLCAVGCSAPTPPSAALATYPSPNYGMDALLVGTLRLTGGCVAVERPDGVLVTPVFPAGDATWQHALLTWHGEEYGEGDSISLGGGLADAQEVHIPEGCSEYEAFLVSPL